LDPIPTARAGWNDAFRDAKVILVGRVVAIETGPGCLVRARVTVENVLQGESREGPVEIYYHRNAANSLEAGQRYVFFLTRDQGVLRAVWDHPRSAILVESGSHGGPPRQRAVADQVSAMLLTPGNDMNAARFARDLAGAVAFAMDHIGRWRTAKLLQRLTTDPRPQIRQSACAQLTAWYWGQDACWDRLDGIAAGAPAAVSRAAERERRARTADPERWWKQMSTARPPADLLDELRLLTTHKDPQIRARYCRFLRAHYPEEQDCGCGAPASVGQASI
jgi:hypothetical protein